MCRLRLWTAWVMMIPFPVEGIGFMTCLGHTASLHTCPGRNGSCQWLWAHLGQTSETSPKTRIFWNLLTTAMGQGLCSALDACPPHPQPCKVRIQLKEQAQRGEVIFPRSYSMEVEWGLHLLCPASQPKALHAAAVGCFLMNWNTWVEGEPSRFWPLGLSHSFPNFSIAVSPS